MTSYLFIGGTADGQRKAVEPMPTIRVPVYQPFLSIAALELQTADSSMHVENYHLREWNTFFGVFSFYLYSKLTDADAMQRLLDHYRPNDT